MTSWYASHHRLIGFVLFFSLALSALGLAHSSAARAATSGHVTILVLDMSGSMAQNDPPGIRCSAANAYIDLSGPGEFVGVVDLDSGGNNSGSLVISNPVEMDTQAHRDALKATIQSKTNNCQPDGGTPTYDALNQAQQMLQASTQNGQISGSVILLTDGAPEPDPNGQINNIMNNLVPQFKNSNWPVDVVALGPPGTQDGVDFHQFLNNVANATSGNFFDDGNGIVPGVSPLNIAPFFVKIFTLRNDRTPGPSIAPTQLSGGTVSRDFVLDNHVDHLDIIVVRDTASTQITLTDPNGATVTASAGVFVATDPHYVIYSIDGPQGGRGR